MCARYVNVNRRAKRAVLFGMKVMSEGIQKTAGSRLRDILGYMTQNRVAGVFTGFIMTCLVQSSSATTIMVISFVNAGLITLVQSIGVIMGANVGTTITGWLVSIFGFKFKSFVKFGDFFSVPNYEVVHLFFELLTRQFKIFTFS